MMKDGLWRVDVGGVCAGFEVLNGRVINCAPILRKSFSFWVKFAELVPTNKPERVSVNDADKQHMPEETMTDTQESEIIDFGFDVTEADVARPVLKSGNYEATIGFVRRDKTQKGQNRLVVGYRLLAPTIDLNGKPVGAGFTIIQRILEEPTGKLTESQIRRRIQGIHFAAAGPGKVNTGAWVGKPVRIRVTLREPHRDETTGEEYDASNEIGNVLPPAKSADA